MSRTAKAFIYGNQLITIETDLYGKVKGKPLAKDLLNNPFAIYLVDKKNRLIYAHEGIGIAPIKIIQAIENDPHPSLTEKFESVDIINEDTGEVLKTFYNVDLAGILRA